MYCHSISGDGGPDLTRVADRLNTYQMTIRVINGGGNTPPFGASLTKKELAELLTFLNTRK